MLKIDLDRGVWMRSHPSIGMDIYMYVDRPGEYLDAHANPVPKALAEAAGFDVEDLEKKRLRREAIEKAQHAIDEQFGTSQPKVHLEREGYKVMDLGVGRFNVHDKEGNLLNKAPISKEQATILLDHLAPKEASLAKKADAPKK